MSVEPKNIIIALGSNLGDSVEHLAEARRLLREQVGTVVAQSREHETEPWGFESTHRFRNQVLLMTTTLTPVELLHVTQTIEQQMGRTHKSHDGLYTDRVIDIDIIDYQNIVFNNEQLTLPHALMHQRAFVLVPLCEVAPQWLHPVLHKTAPELLAELVR